MDITYHDGPEPTSSGFPLQSHPGYGPQGSFVHIELTLKTGETKQLSIGSDRKRGAVAGPYFVHAEQSLVLGHHGVAWLRQDSHQRVLVQAVQRNHHRQAANELRDHPELDQVSGLYVLQQPVLLLDLRHRVRLAAGVGQVCSGRGAPPFPQVGGRSESQVLKGHKTQDEDGGQ